MLDKLFKPQSVALIGASDRPGSFGCDAAKSLIKSQEKLRFYFINQRKSEIFGIRTYPLLAELPEVPELVLIATPASTVNGLIRDAAQRGVHDFIVYSSGFAEDHRCNGEQMERELEALAGEYGLRIVGPNCCGIFNNSDGLSLWGSTGNYQLGRERGTAVLGHSGGYTMGGMDRPWVGITYGISGGNGSIVSQEELAEYCVDDPETKLLCMYMEGIKKPEVVYRLFKNALTGRFRALFSNPGGAVRAQSLHPRIPGIWQAPMNPSVLCSISTASSLLTGWRNTTVWNRCWIRSKVISHAATGLPLSAGPAVKRP